MRNKNTLMLIVVSTAGNAMEWYDFALYGYFATIIAKLFFPSENHFLSLALAFTVFSCGFIARPFGGAIFGYIGDRFGRRRALIYSVAIIAAPTFIIGLLPTYQSVGYFSPILLVIMRLFQGAAVSGELTGTGAFLYESNIKNKKSYLSSFTMASTYIGLVIASLVCFLVTTIFNEKQLIAFAWRAPFLISAVFGSVALTLRMKLAESDSFQRLKEENRLAVSPVKEIRTDYKASSLSVFFLSGSLAVAIYMLIGYLPSYLSSLVFMGVKASMIVSFISLLSLAVFSPVMGFIADKIGNKKIYLSGVIGLLFFSILAFKLISQHNFWSAVLSELIIVFFLSMVAGTIISIMSEQFPTRVRFTGMSIGYNFSMAVFGGLTPIISIYLLKLYKSPVSPGYYLLFSAFLSLFAFLYIHKVEKKKNISRVSFDDEGLLKEPI